MHSIQGHSFSRAEQALAWILFDIREREQCRLLHRARAIWQGDSDIEALDEHHLALIIKGANAWSLAA